MNPPNLRPLRKCAARKQLGLTLVELMVALTLGLLVLMAATALLLSSKSGYMVQDESTRLQETGRYALETIARAVRQTAYQDFGNIEHTITVHASSGANILGFDATSVGSTTPGIDSTSTGGVNGSDLLVLRFFGSPDGTILNCAGFSVAPPGPDYADSDRGWSIFYVAKGNSGEPELRCKYRPADSPSGEWRAEAIARGVESFQVLYGIDTDGDSLPNQFVTATEINKLDGALKLTSVGAAQADERNEKTYWKKVVAVKIGLLLRAGQGAPNDATASRYYPLGAAYGDTQGASDPGTRIETANMSAGERKRIRKVFAMTIQLRNQSSGWSN